MGIEQVTRSQLINWIMDRTVEYRKKCKDSVERNSRMNNLKGRLDINQDEIDAILVDFVNYCGNHQGLDYGLTTNSLNETN